ncbi:SRPBCC family protein [Mycobacterium sp. MBM]|nr:SRPBCC family protein [Mycobacterium sp. MBM]
MPRTAVVKGVDAPAEAVWALLSDFADIGWIPVVDHVEIDGKGLGMTRAINGSGDQPILETLTHRDDERMELGYSIAHSPLPVTRFEAIVTVRPAAGGNGAEIAWEVDYDPQDNDEAAALAAREAIEAVYAMMAGWLADAATQRGHQ